MKPGVMFGDCLGVDCLCFHEMEIGGNYLRRLGDDEVLMSACLIWELETGKSFLHADLVALAVK